MKKGRVDVRRKRSDDTNPCSRKCRLDECRIERDRKRIQNAQGDGYPLRWGEKEEALALRVFLDLDLDLFAPRRRRRLA